MNIAAVMLNKQSIMIIASHSVSIYQK